MSIQSTTKYFKYFSICTLRVHVLNCRSTVYFVLKSNKLLHFVFKYIFCVIGPALSIYFYIYHIIYVVICPPIYNTQLMNSSALITQTERSISQSHDWIFPIKWDLLVWHRLLRLQWANIFRSWSVPVWLSGRLMSRCIHWRDSTLFVTGVDCNRGGWLIRLYMVLLYPRCAFITCNTLFRRQIAISWHGDVLIS